MKGSVRLGLAAVTMALGVAACASRSDVEQLKKEVESLKLTQAQLVKRLGGNPGQNAQAQPAPQAKPLPDSIDMTGANIRGANGAQIVLVEFSDYECPFCIRHYTQVSPLIEQTYIQPGKIRYSFRDFPIDELHPQAIRAHVASRCAAEQGPATFWNLHNRLFTKAGSHTPEAIQSAAQAAGAKMGPFSTCVTNDKYSPTIRQSTAFAISLGATGTPFFVVGRMEPGSNQLKPLKTIPGAFPFARFQEVIDEALAGK